MYRYFAVIWPPLDDAAASAAAIIANCLRANALHDWRQVCRGPGYVVFDAGAAGSGMRARLLRGGRGAVLGDLFWRADAAGLDILDEVEARRCLESRGQSLIERFWGRYVAFLAPPKAALRYIVRDPSGAFPCFHTSWRGAHLWFSDMQDAAGADFLPFTPNRDYLRTTVAFPQFRTIQTGLDEVGELGPGARRDFKDGIAGATHQLWKPAEIAARAPVEDAKDAVSLLRGAVTAAVRALTRGRGPILHNLGGLDSSILLAAMSEGPDPPKITCLNFYTASPQGDERRYAQAMARSCAAVLETRELDAAAVRLDRLFAVNRQAKPRTAFDGIELTGEAALLARSTGAAMLAYGTGGDNVLFQAPYNLGAYDFVRRHGPFARGALQVAMEAARYSGCSLAQTIGGMAREWIRPAPCFEFVRKEIFSGLSFPLIRPAFIAEKDAAALLSPLHRPEPYDLKGKYLHSLFSTLCVNDYYHPYDTDYTADRVRPYFMQPVVEACLSIPVWLMTLGGVDRGLARTAFRHELPPVIARRFSKITPAAFYRDIVARNRRFLREILMDGVLIREGVLDPARVEAALAGSDPRLAVQHSRLLGYAELDIWLSGWIERPVSRPPDGAGAL